jgi:PAS domain S-box-containing protein
LVITISVLYVDDEGTLLDVCKLYLEQTKEFAVTTALSASGALALIKSNGIEAIVSDYQMPEMDGIEFLKQVRATDKTIPFILFTGRGREEIAVEAFENGADSYIQKGGDPKSQFAELVHRLKVVVDRRRAETQVATLNRLYTVLSATNKAIVRIHDKSELLNEICRIAVESGGFTMAWAGLVNGEKHLIEPVAIAGYNKGFLDTITISTDETPTGRGPTGTAFRKRSFNVCNDIESDSKNATPWRQGALDRGYRSLAAFPFALDTRNAGVITFYASEPGFFNDRIIRLLEEQSGDISFALVNLDREEQRMAAEQELKASELRYRRLFQTAQDAILILDGETGEIIDANTFILDMLGYPLDYFIGKRLWELGFLKDKSLAVDAFEKLKAEGYIRYEDLPLETKQGRAINVEFVSNVYLVGDKRIIQCNIRDITGRKTAQDRLQVSETRYRRLFETAQDGILILDEVTGKIIDANTFIQDMLGYPLDYFMDKQLWELGFIKDKSFAQKAFADLKTKAYIRYEDIPLETKDGQGIEVEFISNVYAVNHHKIIQCNIRNITDRKRAEDALALASRKLNLMSGITRHDITNQLTVLSGSLDLALDTVKEPEGIVHINRAQKAAHSIQRQIDFTREYEDLGVKVPVWQRLTEVIRSTASQRADPAISFEIPDDRLEIYADPLLVKVFYNLFDNARQHGGGVTRIGISHHPAGNGLTIIVADNGIGISPEDKTHIFERGFGKNTGLGLFLSREILSITGISISETGIPGKGARFEIAVPAGAFRFGEEASSN